MDKIVYSPGYTVLPEDPQVPRFISRTTPNFPAISRIRKQSASALYFEYLVLNRVVGEGKPMSFEVNRMLAVGDSRYISRARGRFTPKSDSHHDSFRKVVSYYTSKKWSVIRDKSAAHAFEIFIRNWEDFRSRNYMEASSPGLSSHVTLNYSTSSEPMHVPINSLEVERINKSQSVPYLAKTGAALWNAHSFALESESTLKMGKEAGEAGSWMLTPSMDFSPNKSAIQGVVKTSILDTLVASLETIAIQPDEAGIPAGRAEVPLAADRPRTRTIVEL